MVINFAHMVDSETCHFIDKQCLNGYTTPQFFLAFVVPVAATLLLSWCPFVNMYLKLAAILPAVPV